MEFLNKLYANENFGVGLFVVIIFLVIMFLVVLFLGKKDEKKRKLEETNKLNVVNNDKNAFNETTVATSVEVPVVDSTLTGSVSPIEPINPVQPITYEAVESQKEEISNSVVEDANLINNMNPSQPFIDKEIETPIVEPAMPNTVAPSFAPNEVVEPIISSATPANLTMNEVATEPIISMDPTPINIIENSANDAPVIEPINIQVPNETVNTTPIFEEKKPIIEEMPVNNETYYNPVEPIEATTVDVPTIDFDAIAKSISKELDDLEKESNNSYVEVTPMEKITIPTDEAQPANSEELPKVTVVPKTKIELPKKIDLPAKKDEIEPESYQI